MNFHLHWHLSRVRWMVPMDLKGLEDGQVVVSSTLCLNFLMSSGVVLQQPPAMITDHTLLFFALWTISNIAWSQGA
jgi:hypothetical protein